MPSQSLVDFKSLSEFLNNYFPPRKDGRGKVKPQILIIDELEELFRLYPDSWPEQRSNFFLQVTDALNLDYFLRIVIIMREDYLAQLDPFAEILPEMLKPRFRLERLRKDAAFEAIKGPLEHFEALVNDERLITTLFDKHIIDALIEELLNIRVETSGGLYREIKGEYVEPIQLQVVCQRLWNKLIHSKADQISKDYFDVGNALEDFYADAIYEASKTTGTKEDIIRKWFEEKLITADGTRSVVHRGSDSTGGLSNNVISVLENKYVIRKEERSGAQWYELTHECLIKPILDSNRVWSERHREGKGRGNIFKNIFRKSSIQ